MMCVAGNFSNIMYNAYSVSCESQWNFIIAIGDIIYHGDKLLYY